MAKASGTSPKIVPGRRQPSVRSTPSKRLTTSILPDSTAYSARSPPSCTAYSPGLSRMSAEVRTSRSRSASDRLANSGRHGLRRASAWPERSAFNPGRPHPHRPSFRPLHPRWRMRVTQPSADCGQRAARRCIASARDATAMSIGLASAADCMPRLFHGHAAVEDLAGAKRMPPCPRRLQSRPTRHPFRSDPSCTATTPSTSG